MALTLLHSDTFNRADGELNGSTMSDGIGAWTVDAGNGKFSIGTNEGLAIGFPSEAYDSVMGSVGDQKIEVTYYSATADAATIVRYVDGNNYYAHYGANFAFKVVAGSLIGIGSPSFVALATSAHVRAYSVIGSTHEWFTDGTSQGTVTDSDIAAGRAGIYCGGNVNAHYDDFSVYTEPAGGIAIPVLTRQYRARGA